jgi:hypothetical protein
VSGRIRAASAGRRRWRRARSASASRPRWWGGAGGGGGRPGQWRIWAGLLPPSWGALKTCALFGRGPPARERAPSQATPHPKPSPPGAHQQIVVLPHWLPPPLAADVEHLSLSVENPYVAHVLASVFVPQLGSQVLGWGEWRRRVRQVAARGGWRRPSRPLASTHTPTPRPRRVEGGRAWARAPGPKPPPSRAATHPQYCPLLQGRPWRTLQVPPSQNASVEELGGGGAERGRGGRGRQWADCPRELKAPMGARRDGKGAGGAGAHPPPRRRARPRGSPAAVAVL